MGSCINKSNNIITLRIDAQVHNTIFPSYSKSKKFTSTAVSSMDLNSYKFSKAKLPKLYPENISKIIHINNDNDLNSLREICELFD